jgi:type IV pilus biogenesis protein CpaD/CtpE
MEDGMKPVRHLWVVLILVSATLAGCASSPPDAAPTRAVNMRQVDLINAAARHRGLEVHWINYPQKTQP